MDLINSIKYIANKLGEQSGRRENGKFGQRNPRKSDGKKNQTDGNSFSSEYDSHLGRKLDVTV